jgi:hypothetical protein
VQKVDEAREAASLKRAVARESLIEAGMHALVAAGKVLESEGQALERIIERSQPGTRAYEAAVKRAGRTAFQKGLRHEPRGHNMDILKRVPGLKLYIETLVSELGGRANERRDSPLVHIKSTYGALAAYASRHFNSRISRRAVNNAIAKMRRRQGKSLRLDISTRVVAREGLPTEEEQPNAYMLNKALKDITRFCIANAGRVAMEGRDDHATIDSNVQRGRITQVSAHSPLLKSAVALEFGGMLQVNKPSALLPVDETKLAGMYPVGAHKPPSRATHDFDDSTRKFSIAVHLVLTGCQNGRENRKANSANTDLSFSVANVEIGSRDGMQCVAFVRSKFRDRSTGGVHAHETRQVMDMYPELFTDADGLPTRILVINVDRGQDENMRHYGTVMASTKLFIESGLGVLLVVARAAGHSSSNVVENCQCTVTAALAGAKVCCTAHGVPKMKKKSGKDAKLVPASDDDAHMLDRNLDYACADIGRFLEGCNVYKRPLGVVIGTRPPPHLGPDEIQMHRAARSTTDVEDTAPDAEPAANTANHRAVGCGCKSGDGVACSTDRCKSCHGNRRPCNIFCACNGKCGNSYNKWHLPGEKSFAALRGMPIADILQLMTPTDLEVFGLRHVWRTTYCLQVSLFRFVCMLPHIHHTTARCYSATKKIAGTARAFATMHHQI